MGSPDLVGLGGEVVLRQEGDELVSRLHVGLGPTTATRTNCGATTRQIRQDPSYKPITRGPRDRWKSCRCRTTRRPAWSWSGTGKRRAPRCRWSRPATAVGPSSSGPSGPTPPGRARKRLPHPAAGTQTAVGCRNGNRRGQELRGRATEDGRRPGQLPRATRVKGIRRCVLPRTTASDRAVDTRRCRPDHLMFSRTARRQAGHAP